MAAWMAGVEAAERAVVAQWVSVRAAAQMVDVATGVVAGVAWAAVVLVPLAVMALAELVCARLRWLWRLCPLLR